MHACAFFVNFVRAIQRKNCFSVIFGGLIFAFLSSGGVSSAHAQAGITCMATGTNSINVPYTAGGSVGFPITLEPGASIFISVTIDNPSGTGSFGTIGNPNIIVIPTMLTGTINNMTAGTVVENFGGSSTNTNGTITGTCNSMGPPTGGPTGTGSPDPLVLAANPLLDSGFLFEITPPHDCGNAPARLVALNAESRRQEGMLRPIMTEISAIEDDIDLSQAPNLGLLTPSLVTSDDLARLQQLKREREDIQGIIDLLDSEIAFLEKFLGDCSRISSATASGYLPFQSDNLDGNLNGIGNSSPLAYGHDNTFNGRFVQREGPLTWFINANWTFGRDNQAGADRDSDIGLITSGIGYQVNPDTNVGVMTLYRAASVDSTALASSLDVDGYGIGAFISRRFGERYTLTSLLFYEHGNNDVVLGGPTGTFDTSKIEFAGRLSGTWYTHGYAITPSVTISYQHISRDAFTDSAANFFASSDLDTSYLTGNVNASRTWIMIENNGIESVTVNLGIGVSGALTQEEDLPILGTTVNNDNGMTASLSAGLTSNFTRGGSLGVNVSGAGIGGDYSTVSIGGTLALPMNRIFGHRANGAFSFVVNQPLDGNAAIARMKATVPLQ